MVPKFEPMETYASVIIIAIPIFFVLVVAEKIYAWSVGRDSIRINDVISSLSSGMTNVTKDVLGLSVAVISYGWMVENLSLTEVPAGWFTYAVAFIALDFSGYWVHRIAHKVNFFWNNHIIHHSSEDFNLACALRQSISVYVRIFTVFLLPAALLGVPPQVIGIVAPLHLFAQFWYHTRHIGRMGFLEKIIVTPSHHRVHHAINPEYIDKNFGQILIIWDKWFGTFKEESPDAPCVYGVTRPVRTWNPIKINFMHLWFLIRDAWTTSSWKDKLRIWFMPLGWRPEDAARRYPIEKIENVYHYQPYDAGSDRALSWWSVLQFIVLLIQALWLLANLSVIGVPGIFWYGGLIFLGVYALTELMDENPLAWIWEILRLSGVVYLSATWSSGGFAGLGWFGAERLFPLAGFAVLGYSVLALLVAIWWSARFKRVVR